MSAEPKHIPFDEFIRNVQSLFDDMERDGQPVVVERDGQLARLSPERKRAKRRPRHFSMDDPLWDIVGIGRSSGPTDVSSDKHKYLADAAADPHEPDRR